MQTKMIKQTVHFNASPEDVYDALMNSKKHSAFTGSKAVVSDKVGGKFSAYEGGLHGKNVALEKGRKIVQEWRCEMANWPKEHFSTATFSLSKEKKGTKLVFTQTMVPESCAASIAQGWHDYYWTPMEKFFEESAQSK